MADGRQWLYGKAPEIWSESWPDASFRFRRVGIESINNRAEGRGATAAIRDGNRFQRVVSNYFAGQITEGWFVLDEVCFVAELAGGKARRLYVDVLAINPIAGKVVVIEAKRTHVAASYKQIWDYMAVVRKFFDKELWEVSGIEVCKMSGVSFDYAGAAKWMVPGVVKPPIWDGNGLPVVGIVPWYMGSTWLLR